MIKKDFIIRQPNVKNALFLYRQTFMIHYDFIKE